MAGRRRAAVAATGAAALLLGLVGYAAADVYDLAPGPLTVETPAPAPSSFPPAPGAELPDDGALATDVPAPLGTDAPLPDPAVLRSVITPLLTDPALGPSVSTSVVDALTGEVLLDAAAATPREPASVAKLLTAAAALHRLGPDHTVDTQAVRGVAPDEVVLLAGGDVLLAAGAGDAASANGRAGLADLAAQTAEVLLAEGTTTVAVRVDDSLFTGPRMGPGWTQADVAAGFVAPVTAIAVNAGRTTPERYAPRVADPALAAAATFARLLTERGVTVAGEAVRGIAPPGAEELGTITSAPLADVVGYMLATSDNNVAEALARLVAADMGRPTAFADAARAVLDEVAMLGADTTGATLTDGSGLADGSRLPASLLTEVLALAASPEHPELRPLLTGLPVAALNGTLSQRFAADPAAAGLVRAKTGSLTGVTSLAGTVADADGRLLVFAVLADAVPATDPAREAADTVAAALVACGCR